MLPDPVCASTPCSHPHTTLGRYTEPKPREHGLFVEGRRVFTVTFNAWRLLGDSGEVRGEAGMPNADFIKPITEHLKNLLRGRKAWGLAHQLTDTWAQLPAGVLELPLAQRFSRAQPNQKRSRAGGPKASVPMADLGSAEE